MCHQHTLQEIFNLNVIQKIGRFMQLDVSQLIPDIFTTSDIFDMSRSSVEDLQ